jgi:hypothetical protein
MSICGILRYIVGGLVTKDITTDKDEWTKGTTFETAINDCLCGCASRHFSASCSDSCGNVNYNS